MSCFFILLVVHSIKWKIWISFIMLSLQLVNICMHNIVILYVMNMFDCYSNSGWFWSGNNLFSIATLMWYMSSGQALSRYSLFWLLKLTVNSLLTAAVYVYRVALCASVVYAILILSVCVHMSILVLAISQWWTLSSNFCHLVAHHSNFLALKTVVNFWDGYSREDLRADMVWKFALFSRCLDISCNPR